MRSKSIALALTGALALLAAGCGSGSSSTTTTSTTAPSATTPPTTTPTQTTTTNGSSSEQSTQSTPGGSSSSQTPENSIKTYGSAASAAEKAAISATAFSFFKAMATSNYAKLCTGLSASNKKELEAFDKVKHKKLACSALLKELISTRGAPEARKAATGKLISVRVKGPTAFVIFKPTGGTTSYFVLKREGSAWKAISLAPGSPLNPVAR
ncbi:MAG TPA: hypothetical protein VND98_00030 [Solirubrobacterales bacterium]|nr:hypothetical protein [Solirubrobacterales bacterium]